ncbi:hypothetical protein D9M73_181300 [compost metagenome]
MILSGSQGFLFSLRLGSPLLMKPNQFDKDLSLHWHFEYQPKVALYWLVNYPTELLLHLRRPAPCLAVPEPLSIETEPLQNFGG